MLIDITRTIGSDTLVYPGDKPAELIQAAAIAEGDKFNVTALSMSSHTGTHLDSPLHYLPEGESLAAYPLSRLVGPAVVVEYEGAGPIAAADLPPGAIKPGDAVLFKTRNSKLSRECYNEDYVHLARDCAERLVELAAALVGIDYLSVDAAQSRDYPVHNELMRAGVLILEDIDMRQTRAGRFRLVCLPLKISGTEAAPCRAILETLDDQSG